MRILYHAVNGTGLGHLMRTTAVAAHVRRLRGDSEQLILTNASFSAHARQSGIPTVNLPPDDDGPFAAFDRRLKTITREMAGRFTDAIAREYRPDAVVFDTHVDAELARRLAAGRTSVLILREAREPYLQWCIDCLIPAIDLVIIPHRRSDFFAGLSDQLATRFGAVSKLSCVGPIVYPESLDDDDVQATLARHGITADQRIVVIACGSGGYDFLAHRFLEAATRAAVDAKQSTPNLRVLCVAGPYAESARGFAGGAELIPAEARFQHLLARADAVIAHGGYNTVQEILRTGARAILVSVHRKSEDQGQRLRALERLGRIRVLDGEASVLQFREALEATLREPRATPEQAEGGEAAARTILDRLDGAPRSRVDWRQVGQLPRALPAAGTIEIALGGGTAVELESRARAALEALAALGLPLDRTTLELVDAESGESLAALTERLRDCSFGMLLACVPVTAAIDRRRLFAILERCRAARPRFRYDITARESPT
jgi:predicted glycosyltransferase